MEGWNDIRWPVAATGVSPSTLWPVCSRIMHSIASSDHEHTSSAPSVNYCLVPLNI